MQSTARFLDHLRTKRLKWIEANRENNFEGGILNLLTELYPEQAHFIFELFQNAEDALASSISFCLKSDRLTVTHDGKRQFDEKDVDSITSIGQSTKKDDFNQIGKFGVGFKAVFSYTATPIVHSEKFHFEIRDLVCPHPVEIPSLSAGFTQFIFPFNNPNKRSQRCFEEVTKSLTSLSDNVLLFLNNLSEIYWDIEGKGNGRLVRSSRNDDVIEIKREDSNASADTSTYWLRFQKAIPGREKLFVGVAYSLGLLDTTRPVFDNTSKLHETFRITPLSKGQLSIYFPAEKEETKLKFHIHGPYASTVARDSIKCGHDGNQQLLELTSALVSESLHQIKVHGLLTTDFLAVLPNDKDSIDDFYEPILAAIIEEFKAYELLPGRYTAFVDAITAKNGPADIKNVLSDSDLAFFCNDPDSKWVAAAKQRNSRADNFLESLEIEEWGWEELKNVLNAKFAYAINPDTRTWINSKSDEWMQKFYVLLDTLFQEKKYYIYGYENWSIIRISSGLHVKGNEAFFPDENNESDAQFPRVKLTTIKGANDRNIEKAKNLLRQLGVSEVGEKQEIETLLNRYYKVDSPDPTEKQHLQHITFFANWWKEHRDTELFRGYFVFRSKDGTYHTPADLFLDQPYKDTGLKDFFAEIQNNLVEIWDGYSKLRVVYEFAVAVGIKDKIDIVRVNACFNPDWGSKLAAAGKVTAKKTNEDYTISNLDTYLKRSSKSVALLIWRTVANAPKEILKARYCPNWQTPYKYADSQLVHHLKNHAWIPAIDGKYYHPTGISQDMLLPEFRNFFVNTNGWLDAIGFGEKVKKQTEEYLKQKEYADKLGIPLEIAEQLKKIPNAKRNEFFQKWQGEIHSFFNPQPIDPLPSSPAPNPDRRAAKALEAAEEAEEKKYELKSRSIKTTGITKVKKTYIIDQNSNEYGHIYCQLCHSRMPFSINGADYFEAIEFVREVTREIPSNALALCPNCAAEYTYACTTSEQERIEQLLSLDSKTTDGTEWEISLELPVHTHIRFFSQKHLIDLQGALEVHQRNSGKLQDDADEVDSMATLTKSLEGGDIFVDAKLIKTTSSVLSSVSSLKQTTQTATIPFNQPISETIKNREKYIDKHGYHVEIYRKISTASSSTLKLCPHCNAKIKENKFQKHITSKCPKLHNRQNVAKKLHHYQDVIPKPTPLTEKQKRLLGALTAPKSNPAAIGNRCKFCGSHAMAGSDVCYSCG